MAQRPPGFIPDGFIADEEPTGFVPDGFEPDEAIQSPKVRTVQKPWYLGGELQEIVRTPEEAQAEREKVTRQEKPFWKIGSGAEGVGKFFDSVRENVREAHKDNPYIPDFLETGLARLMNVPTYYAQMAGSIAAEPIAEDFVFPSAVNPSRLARTFAKPPVPPAPASRPRINLLEGRDIKISPPIERQITKEYPAMMTQNPAEDTLLAYALRESPNPEQILYPRDNTPISGFDLYALQDEAIQESIRRPEMLARERFRRFMEPSGTPQIPADPFSKRLGFNEFERMPDADTLPHLDKPLRYPENIVPHQVLPRTAQSQLEALTPERLKVPPHIRETEIPHIDSVISPSDALPLERRTGGILAPGGTATTTRKGTRGFDDRVRSYVQRNVAPAIPEAPEAIAPILAQNRTWWQKFRDHMIVSGERQLEKMGPVGQEIRKALNHVEYSKREMFNQFAHPYLQAVQKLTPEEHLNFVMTMDGAQEALTPNVAAAVAETRKITDLMAKLAKEAGVRVKTTSGKTTLFQGLEKYWPHRAVNPIPHTAFIDDLMKHNPNLTRLEAEKLSQRFLNESEFFNSPQHQRIYGEYEWRKDLNAMIDHMADMADIIARAKHLGPGDIGLDDTFISQLIKQASDRVEAHRLVKTHLRGAMDKNDDYYQMVKKANEVATKFQVFTKLSLFPISNLNNQMQTMLWGNLDEFSKALVHAITGSQELKTLAREYGTVSVGEIPMGILSEAGKRPVPVVGNLVTWADNFARTVATGTGQGTARNLFRAAKDGNKMATRRLQNLLLENDIEDILKQPELTSEQLKFATHRFVELSQQLNSNMKVPPAWVNVPELGIPLIFKKFAFQGTKSIVDAIMMDPKRNAFLFLVAAPMFGELTGDIKSAVYGAIRGAPMPDEMFNAIIHEIENRHRFAENLTGLDSDESEFNNFVNRLAANYTQSWALGLLGDIMQGALGGKHAGYSALFGPAVDQAISVVTGIGSGDFKAVGREGLRSIPVIGPGLQRRLLPTEAQEMP